MAACAQMLPSVNKSAFVTMAKSLSLHLGFTLLVLASQTAAAAAAEATSGPGDGPAIVSGAPHSATGPRKAKTVSGPVNTAGAKGATTVASVGGRVFLARPSASFLAALKAKKHDWVVIQLNQNGDPSLVATMKTEKPGRKWPAHWRGRHRGEEEIAAAPPNRVRVIPGLPEIASQSPTMGETAASNSPPSPPSPRVELGGSLSETPAVAPPAIVTAPRGSQLPGMDDPVPSREPVVLSGESAPLVKPMGLPAGGARGGVGALASGGLGGALNSASPKAPPVIGSIRIGMPRGQVPLLANQYFLWSCVLFSLLLLIGKSWHDRRKSFPWLSYTEDWVDGFLWRWKWRNDQITNLRAFCPSCDNEVILRPVAAARFTESPTEPLGTWALCTHCKEATHLEVDDVSQTVSEALIRKKNSGEYQEKDAAFRQKAANASGRILRIKP